MTKNIVYWGLTVITPGLVGLAIYFLKDLIRENKAQHKDFETKVANVEEGTKLYIGAARKEINDELKEQRKKLMQVEEVVIKVDAKQERLDIFATRIDDITKAVKRETESNDEIKDDLKKANERIEKLEKCIKNDTIEIPSVDHILNSEVLTEVEKQAIRDHVAFLQHSPMEVYKIIPFIKYIETKIQRKIEELKLRSLGPKSKISESLWNEIKGKK